MRFSTLVMKIAIVCLAAILLGCIDLDGGTSENRIVLSNYPKLF